MELKQELLERIESRRLSLGIVGLGYVGLPLAVAFAEEGFNVVGVDVSTAKVKMFNAGESYVEDVPSEQLLALVQSGRLHASTSYTDLADVDAISICVPTPLRKTKEPDISFVVDAAERIAATGSKGKLIVLESTTYPGTTEEIIMPRLIENGERVGRDFFLAFSPERIDPGRIDHNIRTTPKVIGGMTKNCLEIASALYGAVVDEPVAVSNTRTAEMVKLLENTFRAVNIGLVNEMALICDRLDLDVWEVVEAAATKPFGFMPFFPGPGLGGHCIPVDPHYLSWKMRTLDYRARFIELAAEVNGQMPNHVVGKVSDALNSVFKPINGSTVLILGVSYKPDVGDVRESPALDIMHLLQERGAELLFHDPFVCDLSAEGFGSGLQKLTTNDLATADCIVIAANHSSYIWPWIVEHAQLVVDTRNALKNMTSSKIIGL